MGIYKAYSINVLANKINEIRKRDFWTLVAVDGLMGIGKSCISTQLGKVISEMSGVPFSFQKNITFDRKELIKWIDGEGEKQTGRLPEFSVIIVDELISLFYKRNYADRAQIDGIELLNKCRDRHLCIIGNVPSFWDLDKAIRGMTNFWIHIPHRGTAWVSQSVPNMYGDDKWHQRYNEKQLAKEGTPYKCRGFIGEVKFSDWSKADKEAYYNVRNTKRVGTEGQRSLKFPPSSSVSSKRAVSAATKELTAAIRTVLEQGSKHPRQSNGKSWDRNV